MITTGSSSGRAPGAGGAVGCARPARAPARPGDDPGLGARARGRRAGHRVLLRRALRGRGVAARGGRDARQTPATLALYGRIYADSVGGLVAWRLGGIALALAGLMSILIVVRHTRAEEETGRAELVGAGVVGRYAPFAAALLVAAIASVALGVVVALGVLGRRARRSAGALASGSAFAAVGLRLRGGRRGDGAGSPSPRAPRTGSRSACSAAPSRCGRSATPGRTAGVAVAARLGQRCARSPTSAGGCCGCCSACAALAAAGASRLSARRDLGAGILPPRPGPARGRLGTPLALAWRLQRGALSGWAVGFAILGAAFGSDRAGHRRRDRRQRRRERRAAAARRRPRASSTPTWPRRSAILALIAAAYAVQADAAAARRGDERARRAAAGHRGLAHALGAQPRRRRARRHAADAPRRGGLRGRRATPPRPATPASSRACSAPRWRRCRRRGCWRASRSRSSACSRAPRRGLGRARALPRAGRAGPGAWSSASRSWTSPPSRTHRSCRAAASPPPRCGSPRSPRRWPPPGSSALRRRDVTS